MANEDVIAQFFASKGLTAPQIAGILGNAQIESGFNPAAFNAGEGAVGIFQWEGGRRTALQAFASRSGTSEFDLTTQLNFAWSELTGPFSGVLNALRGATNPTDAATIWDAQYEISAGTSRAQRIAAAIAALAGGLKGGDGNIQGITGGTQNADNPAPTGKPSWIDLLPFGPIYTGFDGAIPGTQDLASVMDGIANDITEAVKMFSLLFRPSTWLRVGAFLAGLFLLTGGFISLKGAV